MYMYVNILHISMYTLHICIYPYTNVICIPYLCPLRGTGVGDAPTATNKTRTQILAFKYYFPLKGIRLLAKTAVYRSRVEKVHDEPRTSCDKNQGVLQE